MDQCKASVVIEQIMSWTGRMGAYDECWQAHCLPFGEHRELIDILSPAEPMH